MLKSNNEKKEPILPSSEIKEIFERISKGEKTTEKIATEDLSNMINREIEIANAFCKLASLQSDLKTLQDHNRLLVKVLETVSEFK